MTSPRWMSLTQCVLLVCGMAVCAPVSARAQSAPLLIPSAIGLASAGESSSSNPQLMAEFAPAADLDQDSSENSGGSKYHENWKQYLGGNYAFEAGGGANAPVGNDTSSGGGGPFITWGGNFNVGGGVHLSRRFSLLAEYQFIDDKLPGSLIAEVGTQGGHAHIWSLTLDPVVDLFPKHSNSIYLTGGGGFYRKLTSFTVPEEEEECEFYCGIVVANATVYHFSSNQGGMNFGMGFSHRLGGLEGDGKMKLFAEARYLFVDTPPVTAVNGTGTTGLIPVTFGLRW